MSVLNKNEIARRFERGELIAGPRLKPDGTFDIEPSSYDLTAGTAIWKAACDGRQEIRKESYRAGLPFESQPTVTVQPGEMLFVITHEEVKMPNDLCGTVLSRNALARDGILALNAGHVDPGYVGPIVIRLISLRSTTWLLRLGKPIFTIVFEHLEVSDDDTLSSHHPISAEKTLDMVEKSASEALSNALFDLYALEMQREFSRHYGNVLANLRVDLGEAYIKKGDLGIEIWRWLTHSFFGIVVFISLLATIAAAWGNDILDLLRELYNAVQTPN